MNAVQWWYWRPSSDVIVMLKCLTVVPVIVVVEFPTILDWTSRISTISGASQRFQELLGAFFKHQMRKSEQEKESNIRVRIPVRMG